MKDKYACLDEEKKTVKAVRILKTIFKGYKRVAKKVIAAYKWTKENVTVKMAVTVGFILLLVSTFISDYLSAVF